MTQPSSKLTQRQNQELTQQVQQSSSREFETAEELIRFDANQTELPADVTKRLRASLAKEPKPSWWRRFLKRD